MARLDTPGRIALRAALAGLLAFALRAALVGLLALAGLVALATPVEAVDVRMSVSPSRINILQQFEVKLVISGVGGNVTPPEIVVDGATIEHSRESSFNINGRVSLSHAYIGKPTRAGRISIPPVAVTVNGKTYTSRSGATVQVDEVEKRDDFFVEQSATRTQLYREQDVTVTVKVFAERLPGQYANRPPFGLRNEPWPRLDIPWFEEQPGFDGGDRNEFLNSLSPGRRSGFRINGYSSGGLFRNDLSFPLKRSTTTRRDSSGKNRSYFTFEASRTFRATEVGSHVFGPVVGYGNIYVASGRRLDSDSFIAQSDPLEIEVRDVPLEGRPGSYTGAVGPHAITASISGAEDGEIWVGAPLTLRLTVTGAGRLESIGPISIKSQPPVTSVLRVHDEPAVGEIDEAQRSVSFFYGVRAKRADFDAIPPIEFAYFDPDSERFVTVETRPIPVVVKAGKTVGSADVRSFADTDYVRRHKTVRAAIYPNFKEPNALVAQAPPQALGPVAAALLVAPPLVYLGLLVLVTRKRRHERDPSIARAREAGRKARAALKALTERRGGGGDTYETDTFEDVARALSVFVADRLDLPAAGLTPSEALDALERREIAPELRGRLAALFESCELARFGRSAAGTTPATLLETARELLSDLEKETR